MFPIIHVLWLSISIGIDSSSSLKVREDLRNVHPDIFDMNWKLHPVREVADDHSFREFPRVYPCGPDDAQNWYERDPDTCRGYYECTGIWYEHRTCSGDLLYDEKLQRCNWAELVDCGDRPEPYIPPQYHGPAHHLYHPPHDKISEKLTHQQHPQPPLSLNRDRPNNTFDSYDDQDEDYEFFM